MISAIDHYLQTLLTFVPRNEKTNRFAKDYVALIHVPAEGSEKVFSLVFDELRPVFTVASYKETVWELVDQYDGENWKRPELDALQAQFDDTHPVLEYLDAEQLRNCANFSDGRAGLDYYLMLWQREGESGVVECYEPYCRNESSWKTVIGSLQVLASQFEHAAM